MGLAIIMVMLSHLLSVCKEVKPFWLFYPGFLGVDIFLFLSGYGLCRSWESHTPATFYRRRLWRILPLFLLFQAFTTVSQAAISGNLTWADAACNLTTLSFWHLGGTCSEWYLSFLLYLYLLFPLLYALTRKAGPALLYLQLLLLILWQWSADTAWNYDAAFSRLPIFTLGILCHQSPAPNQLFRRATVPFTLSLLAFILLFIRQRAEKYEIVYMAAPLCIAALTYASSAIVARKGMTYRLISRLGTLSLELYVANMMVVSLLQQASLTTLPRIAAYLALQIILTLLLHAVNAGIQKIPQGK